MKEYNVPFGGVFDLSPKKINEVIPRKSYQKKCISCLTYSEEAILTVDMVGIWTNTVALPASVMRKPMS